MFNFFYFRGEKNVINTLIFSKYLRLVKPSLYIESWSLRDIGHGQDENILKEIKNL